MFAGEGDRGVEVRMVPRLFDVENAPALVDFRVLAALGRKPDESKRHTVLGMQFQIERNVVGDVRKPLQSVDVVRF